MLVQAVQGKTPNRFKGLYIAMALGVVLLSFMVAISFGAESFDLVTVLSALSPVHSASDLNILREIRIPRVVAALLVGAALGVSGAIMQGVTRNPLADPGLLGVSSGAQLALALTMMFLPKVGFIGFTLFGILGASLGGLLVLFIGSSQLGGMSPVRLVLAGAAVSTLFSALAEGMGLMFKFSKNLSMWNSGGLMGVTSQQLLWVGSLIVLGITLALMRAPQLTILGLGEEVALGLGQNVEAVKGFYFIVNVILAGSAVALAGNLGFVGLIMPHIARKFVGSDYRWHMPMTMLLGSSFLMLADCLARVIGKPYETPLIAVVAVLGIPAIGLIQSGKGRLGL